MPDFGAIAPGTRLGPYEITGQLDSGGMGDVYRARDPRLGRDVAIKVLREQSVHDPARLQRFEDEARAAGALGHPNVLVVYDVGRYGDISYLVSELLEGQTLRDVLVESGAVPLRKALEWASQIAQGLAAAHDKGIVHRDLKPKNLFVTRDGRIKILDFGLAKLIEAARDSELTATVAERTRPGVILGTVGYMAPEQVRGQTVGPPADIFTLGIVIHEMLTGAAPFARETSAETLTAILRDDPPSVPASVPPAIERVVRRCLEKRPEDRFRSAHDLSLALDALSGGTGAVADVHAIAQVPRVSRRRVLAGAGTVLGLGVGLGAGAFLWRRSESVSLPSYQRLTYRRGMIRTARFGPDFQTIYYGALWDGDVCRIYTARSQTPESAPLQNLPAATPLAISTSGELALSLGNHLRSVMPYGTLARVSLTGGAPRELAERVKYADFSPDGRDLAVVRLVDGVERLEYPLGNVVAEPSVPGGGFSFPRVSRDGNRVACFELASTGGLIGTVLIVDRAGGKRVISPQYFNCFGLAWKGDEIWFTAAGDRPLFRDAIYALAPGGLPRQIARLPGNASLHDVAPDGRFLMARTDDRGGIAAFPPGETSERDLSWLDFPVPVDISRDGRSMLFSEAGVGGGPQGSVYVRSTTGAPAVRLGDGRAIALSPDGQWALAADPASFDASSYIELLPVGPGETRRIQQPGFAYNNARWLPDAKRLVVRAQEKGQSARFYELSVDDGAMRAFTPEGIGLFWSVSPDGDRVAVTAASGVEIHSVSGGQTPQKVPGLSGPQVLVAWIDRGLLVYDEPNPNALGKVLLIDPVTGARQTWREILPRDPSGIMNMGALVVTPDGGSYAYWWFRALSDLYLGSELA